MGMNEEALGKFIEEQAKILFSEFVAIGEESAASAIKSRIASPSVDNAVVARSLGDFEAAIEIDYDHMPHLRFLMEGTGIYGERGEPFVIAASKKKALAFEVDGHVVFASKAVIQGIQPRITLDEVRDIVRAELMGGEI